MPKIYANVFITFSNKPFPANTSVDLKKAAQTLGLEPIVDQPAQFKFAAARMGWKEDMSNDPRYAPTPIPDGTSETDRAVIEATNAGKAEALKLAQNPQWYVEDSMATAVLALIHDEKAQDVTPRNQPEFQKQFAETYETA